MTGTKVCVKVPAPFTPPPPPAEEGGGPAGGLNLSTVVDTCAVSSMILWVVWQLMKRCGLEVMSCGVWVNGPVWNSEIEKKYIETKNCQNIFFLLFEICAHVWLLS